jgi:hypothetical protein
MASTGSHSKAIRKLLATAGYLVASVSVALGCWLGWQPQQSAFSEEKKPRQKNESMSASAPIRGPQYVVLGYNDLGMHCMNQDFSEICLLPPYNTLRAQVIRRGEEPQIVTKGVTVHYKIPGNTSSTLKTNFWNYSKPLFGVTLQPNIGLTGSGLSGTMKPTRNNDWSATGIPITPLLDTGELNPYPLATVSVVLNRRTVATTKSVVPVSWEISCNICHNTPGISVATDILRKHDRLHPKLPNGTPINLEASKPVLCASCHGDPALGTKGAPGVSSMSRAMHHSHQDRMDPAKAVVGNNTCYACHPGNVTHCQRDIHISKGVQCTDCHGGLSDVAKIGRTPWVTEPSCGSCHSKRRPNFQFEEPGKLFKDSRGHGGVHCSACHGSPHAITPTVTEADNVQSVMHQGFAGAIKKCTVCHTKTPHDPFPHKLFGEGIEDD